MNRRIVGTALYVVIGTFASLVLAEEKRQLDSHVHGAAKMDLVVEGQAINIYFESPAMNIVGFEHAPETSEQQSLVEEAKKALGAVSNTIELPEQAGCVLTHNSVEWSMAHEEHEENEDHEEHAKQEDHEEHEENEEHEEQASHSEFQAEYAVECKNIAVVESLTVKLFDQYQGLEEIALQAALPSGQTAMKMTPSSNTISLR